jgi:secretion/DNA translocation related TadE-like protein
VTGRAAGREAGSAGLLAVWVAVLVLAASTLAVGWAGVVVARHRASGIADLTALAAAGATANRSADPCVAAARVAVAGGARLESCRQLADGSTGVVVAVDGPSGVGLLRWFHTEPARARARAGVPP